MAEDIKQGPKKPLGKRINLFYIILFTASLAIYFWVNASSAISEISWKQFSEEMLIPGDVQKIDVVNNERVEITIIIDSLTKPRYKDVPKQLFNKKPIQGPQYFFNIGSVEVFNAELDRIHEKYPATSDVEITYTKRENWWPTILSWMLPVALVLLFWMYIFRRTSGGATGGRSIFNFGKTNAKVLEKGQRSNVTFDDVAGIEEAKEEIYEIVKFLKSPEKYQRLGAKIPKGVLLSGPPGSGKTLLAKAVAGEAGVPFFSLSGSEFVEMFVGVGAARMRDLFEQAKAKAPSIIFIDEIDTIGRSRGQAAIFQGNEERESTLNQLLAELDGFDTNTGVIVLAATNRGDILDPALLRPGRFDRRINLELPDIKEREAIFKVHMRPLKLDKSVDVKQLSTQTPGFSGADIANICNEAALIAARKEKDAIYMQDFMDAIDRVIGGLEKKSKVITPEEKKRIAVHESGHVLAGWYLEHAPSVLKVTIIPRGRSLGAAWYLPEEHNIVTKHEFMDMICIKLGGRAAEELVYGEISSNALDDLENVTKQAYMMVMNYGLSNALRNISYFDSTGRSEYSMQKPFSEKTAELIDKEVQAIVDQAYERVSELLAKHEDKLKELASLLAKKEVLHQKEIEKILGARPGKKEAELKD